MPSGIKWRLAIIYPQTLAWTSPTLIHLFTCVTILFYSEGMEVEISTLNDTPFQLRIVELLLTYKDHIFGTRTHTAGATFPVPGIVH